MPEQLITLVGLKSCDTCRKAKKVLEAAGCDVLFQDVRSAPPDRETLTAWLSRFGPRLVNRRSTTWRTLDRDEQEMTVIELLQAYPAVMKRPVVITSETVHLGWDADVQTAILDD